MSKLYLCFVVCMIAVLAVQSAPLKDQDIEELLYKLQELRHQNEGIFDDRGEFNLIHSPDESLGNYGQNIFNRQNYNDFITSKSRRSLDSLGGGYLIKKRRNSLPKYSALDQLGGGHLLRRK